MRAALPDSSFFYLCSVLTQKEIQILNLGVIRGSTSQMVGISVVRVARATLASQPWLTEAGKACQHCFCAKCGNDLTGRVECATESNGMLTSPGHVKSLDRSGLLCVFCGASEIMSARSFRKGQVHVVQQTTMTLAPPV